MRGERRRQLLPLAHEPHHLLLGALALGGRFAHALAVRVEGRDAQTVAELGPQARESASRLPRAAGAARARPSSPARGAGTTRAAARVAPRPARPRALATGPAAPGRAAARRRAAPGA